MLVLIFILSCGFDLISLLLFVWFYLIFYLDDWFLLSYDLICVAIEFNWFSWKELTEYRLEWLFQLNCLEKWSNFRCLLPVGAAVATATPIPNGSLNQHSETRPVFPVRPSYGVAAGRAHITVDATCTQQPSENSFSTQSSYDSRSSLINPAAMVAGQGPVLANDMKRNNQGHPLKSFTVPAPPPPSAPPIKIVSPINNRTSVNPSSPYKKSVVGPVSPPVLRVPGVSGTDLRPLETIQPSYSTEELNQEMANLEGLMKDLNAITASSDFNWNGVCVSKSSVSYLLFCTLWKSSRETNKRFFDR